MFVYLTVSDFFKQSGLKTARVCEPDVLTENMCIALFYYHQA